MSHISATVAVIGGAGHVGLPFSIVCTNSTQYDVVAIDIDAKKCGDLNTGFMPYIEESGDAELDYALATGRLKFSIDECQWALDRAAVICIMIGTPVDAENNPRLDDLFDYFDKTLIPSLVRTKHEKLIILRSTVNPGTTALLRTKLDKALTGRGRKVHLVFAPERVAQGYGIIETKILPQIIGAGDDESWLAAKDFFLGITKECIRLSVKEAELAKLVTNMTRYVNFALANEFYMIADSFASNNDPVDINKIIDACNHNYPRMNLPKPGPNVGGPCLFKDGKFLTSHIPYGDLINNAFLINEGFVNYLFEKIRNIVTARGDSFDTLAILGMTFKKDSDDIRNSLSFRMAKVAKQRGVKVLMCDPLWLEGNIPALNKPPRAVDFDCAVDNADAVVIMTPHTIWNELINKKTAESTQTRHFKWIVDVWKCLDLTREQHSPDGISYVPFNRKGVQQ